MHELEAKFLTTDGAVPEDVLRRLQESLAWAGYRIQPKGRHAFTDRYFDSVDHQLRAAGWSYRERQDEQGRHVALKEINRSRAAIFDREEVEQALTGDEDLGNPGPGPVKDRLSNVLHPDAGVVPLFTVANDRAAYSLSHPDYPRGLVEMAFDAARIEARDTVAFRELALELKNGSHELLASILAAVELEPMLIEARLSKFERGLIAAGCPLERRRSLKPKALDRRARWVDLAIVHLKAGLYHIRLYEPHAWEGLHPEGVHQMRLAMRRAREALRAFADVLPADTVDDLEPRLRRMASVLGRVREVDVHDLHLAAYGKDINPPYGIVLDRYREHLARRRQAAQRELRAALAGTDYAGLAFAYRHLLTAVPQVSAAAPLRVEQMAPAAVAPLLERLRRRGHAIANGTLWEPDDRRRAQHDPTSNPDDSPNDDLRRLRPDVTRLHHHLEFFAQTHAREVEPAATALRELQQILDAHDEARVAKSELGRYRKLYAVGDLERSLLKHLIRLEQRRAHRHRQRFADAWQRFDAAALDLPQRLASSL